MTDRRSPSYARLMAQRANFVAALAAQQALAIANRGGDDDTGLDIGSDREPDTDEVEVDDMNDAIARWQDIAEKTDVPEEVEDMGVTQDQWDAMSKTSRFTLIASAEDRDDEDDKAVKAAETLSPPALAAKRILGTDAYEEGTLQEDALTLALHVAQCGACGPTQRGQ